MYTVMERVIREIKQGPVSKFTKQVKETGEIKLFTGSKNFYRDFVCVDDLVEIVLNNKERVWYL